MLTAGASDRLVRLGSVCSRVGQTGCVGNAMKGHSMKFTFKSTMAVTALASAALLGGTVAAHAAGIVAVGGDTTERDVALEATTDGIYFDTDYGIEMLCEENAGAGSVAAGAAVPGLGLLSLTPTTSVNCVLPEIFDLPVTVTYNDTWEFSASGPAVNGVAPGTVSGVEVRVESDLTDFCNFTAAGDMRAEFDSTAQQLRLLAEPLVEYPLAITDAQGCLLFVQDGDVGQFVADYDVTTDEGAITFQ